MGGSGCGSFSTTASVSRATPTVLKRKPERLRFARPPFDSESPYLAGALAPFWLKATIFGGVSPLLRVLTVVNLCD
jgi:hypothetical protein